jgi:hypothetical protein
MLPQPLDFRIDAILPICKIRECRPVEDSHSPQTAPRACPSRQPRIVRDSRPNGVEQETQNNIDWLNVTRPHRPLMTAQRPKERAVNLSVMNARYRSVGIDFKNHCPAFAC